MDYYINCNNFKRFFTLPCCVAEKYLKLANEASLKVLIFLMSFDSDKISTQDIMNATGIKSANDVDDALLFWADEHIIAFNSEKESVTDDSPHIETINKEIKKAIVPEEPKTVIHKNLVVKYYPKDLKSMVDDSDELKFLLESLQNVYKRTINYTEQGVFINLNVYYGLPATVILMLVDYCISINKSNPSYIEKIGKAWSEEGITTHQTAEAQLIKMIDRNTFSNKIKQIFNLPNNLTPTQLKYIYEWEDFKLSFDMIQFASEKCIDRINKIDFKYIDTILKNWHHNNYKTRNDVPEKQDKSSAKEPESKEHSYDLNEFYKMAINNMPDFKGE